MTERRDMNDRREIRNLTRRIKYHDSLAYMTPEERKNFRAVCTRQSLLRGRIHPEYNRRLRLRYIYKITPEEYEAKLKSQGGVCMICARVPGKLRLAIDHDHKTGRVRGLLCAHCNSSVSVVERGEVKGILEYLDKWRDNNV